MVWYVSYLFYELENFIRNKSYLNIPMTEVIMKQFNLTKFIDVFFCETYFSTFFWLNRDTAGQERFAPLAPMYYRGANAALVVFDIVNPVCFSLLFFFSSFTNETFYLSEYDMKYCMFLIKKIRCNNYINQKLTPEKWLFNMLDFCLTYFFIPIFFNIYTCSQPCFWSNIVFIFSISFFYDLFSDSSYIPSLFF